MDLRGIADGGVIVPIVAVVAAIVLLAAVGLLIRGSAARMAQRDRERIERLRASTQVWSQSDVDQDIDGHRTEFRASGVPTVGTPPAGLYRPVMGSWTH